MGHFLLYITMRGAEEEVFGGQMEMNFVGRSGWLDIWKGNTGLLYFDHSLFFHSLFLYQLEFSGLIFFHSFFLSLSPSFSSSEGLQHWVIMLMIN